MTQPDFIIIPTQLLADEGLQPSDRILFGYIYWMTKLALMKCVASNGMLASLTGFSERGIRQSLERLESAGYIGRIYSDARSHHRLEIVCKLAFSATQVDTKPPIPEIPADLGTNVPSPRNKRAGGLGTNVPHNKIINNKKIKEEVVTIVTTELEAPVTHGKQEINELFQYWEQTCNVPIAAKRQQNRNACNNLYKRYGLDGMRKLVDGVALAQADRYAPRISDFCDLQAKLTQLLTWGKTAKGTQAGRITKI